MSKNLGPLLSLPQTLTNSLVSLLVTSLTDNAPIEETTGETTDQAPLWQPDPKNKPQQQAFDSDADIIGYGGKPGGGKTDLLLGESLNHHRKTVIFRREATQLRGIIDRSLEIIGGHGRLNEQSHIWRGLPGGRSLEFGGIKEDKDINKWRGRAHDLKAFDEAPEFTEAQVRLMMAWCRTTEPGQKCQTILAFNPPSTSEGRWILVFFAPWLDPKHPNPALPGELRWYARIDDKDLERPDGEPFEHNGEMIKPLSRTFFPSSFKDNSFLDQKDYEAQLQSLPEPYRSQLLYGDFQAGIKDDDWQVIPTEWVKLAQQRWKRDGRPKDDQGNLTPLTALGVDVSRGGDDNSVLAPRYDNWFDELFSYPGRVILTGPHLVEKIILFLLQRGEGKATDGTPVFYPDYKLTLQIIQSSVPVNIDVIGWGASAYDVARAHGITARPVNVGEGSKARDKSGKLGFVNKRAELMWRFREALDPANDEKIALPPDSILLADLTAARYSIQSNGIKIESKDDIKKRIQRSPDRGEAVILAYAQTKLQMWV